LPAREPGGAGAERGNLRPPVAVDQGRGALAPAGANGHLSRGTSDRTVVREWSE